MPHNQIDAKRECCEILSTAEIFDDNDRRKTSFVRAWDCADRVHKAFDILAPGATGTVKEALEVRDELDKFAVDYRAAKREVRVVERRITAFESMYETFDNFVPQPPKKSVKMVLKAASASGGFVRRTISDEKQRYVSSLLALERDFKNYTYAHCTMLDQLGELVANKELYSTNVLEDATQDPYVRTAYAARCLSAVPKPGYYTTSASIVMPAKDTTVYAKFVSKSSDKKALKFASSTAKLATTAASYVAGKDMDALALVEPKSGYSRLATFTLTVGADGKVAKKVAFGKIAVEE